MEPVFWLRLLHAPVMPGCFSASVVVGVERLCVVFLSLLVNFRSCLRIASGSWCSPAGELLCLQGLRCVRLADKMVLFDPS